MAQVLHDEASLYFSAISRILFEQKTPEQLNELGIHHFDYQELLIWFGFSTSNHSALLCCGR
jgi:hypothetical protein